MLLGILATWDTAASPSSAAPTNSTGTFKYFASPKDGRVLFIQNVEPVVQPKVQAGLAIGATNPAAILLHADRLQPGLWAQPEVSRSVSSADRFLEQHGAALGARQPAQELTAQWGEIDGLGMSHVHYLQNHQSVPVFAADAAVHLDRQGVVRSAGGYLAPDLTLDTTPLISTNDAIARAIGHWFALLPQAKLPDVSGVTLYVLPMDLVLHDRDPSVFLVWEIKFTTDCPAACEYFYIDALTGDLRLQLSGERRLTRRIYDCSAVPGTSSCLIDFHAYSPDYTFGRSEGQPLRGPNPRYPGANSTDVDDLYDLFPRIMDYYQTKFGRNGANNRGGLGDGAGADWSITTAFTYLDFVSTWTCPNASFLDWRIRFCRDTVIPDVVGHEYAHAVSKFSHYNGSGTPVGIVWDGESGALDENQADVAGEMFEKTTTGSLDWINTLTKTGLALRNLQDPPSLAEGSAGSSTMFFHPDRFHSVLYYCGSTDLHGVHINSTVPSKAAYLASSGGNFNGCTMIPIGKERVEQIWYRAVTQYYAQSETFNGAYYKLIQACSDLYGADSDATRQLRRALQSVELDQAGLCSGTPPRLPEAVDVEGF